MPQQPLVVGLGEVLWDLLPEGKRAGGAPLILPTTQPPWVRGRRRQQRG